MRAGGVSTPRDPEGAAAAACSRGLASPVGSRVVAQPPWGGTARWSGPEVPVAGGVPGALKPARWGRPSRAVLWAAGCGNKGGAGVRSCHCGRGAAFLPGWCPPPAHLARCPGRTGLRLAGVRGGCPRSDPCKTPVLASSPGAAPWPCP